LPPDGVRSRPDGAPAPYPGELSGGGQTCSSPCSVAAVSAIRAVETCNGPSAPPSTGERQANWQGRGAIFLASGRLPKRHSAGGLILIGWWRWHPCSPLLSRWTPEGVSGLQPGHSGGVLLKQLAYPDIFHGGVEFLVPQLALDGLARRIVRRRRGGEARA